VVADIRKLIESIRSTLPAGNGQPKAPAGVGQLPRWDGTVLGPLIRRELYDDVG
jgi:hypothetical protein